MHLMCACRPGIGESLDATPRCGVLVGYQASRRFWPVTYQQHEPSKQTCLVEIPWYSRA
ncbi:hypothetical protein IG631_04826 [Alternaria alternata]|nr:hypothetical protein IG631_04826 [Alternaria alternata]